jgi:hypothetical protein
MFWEDKYPNGYDDLFRRYTLEPLVILNNEDPRSVQVAVKQQDGTWIPRCVCDDDIWGYPQVWDYLNQMMDKAERAYFQAMSNLSAQRKTLDEWFYREYGD